MVVEKRIDELIEGDLVDLEDDKYADSDPENDNHSIFEQTYAQVLQMVRETENCVLVYFDLLACGFPPDHKVKVAPTKIGEI